MFTNKKILIFLILVVGLIIAPIRYVFSVEEKTEKQFAYVACEDRRIYVIDLVKKEVVLKSDEIKDMGWPTAIDIDQKQGRLYVASERGYMQDKYTPLVVFDINTSPIGVINYFDLIVEKRIGRVDRVSAVYEVYVWPDGKKLLLGYGHPKYNRGTTVINSSTGEILSLLNFKIHLREIVFSSDQTKISKIWEKGHAVYDLVNNKQISSKKGEDVFRDEIGLNPPWAKITLPLYTVVDYKYLRVINRDNGKILLEIDLEKITGGLGTSTRHPLIFDKGTKAIIPMMDMNQQGYVVVIDLEKKEVISKIEVGKDPTNVVLSNYAPKPLE